MSGIKRLFYDLETSPNIMYSWRAGYKLNLSHESIIQERAIICACYKWEHCDKIYSIRWEDGDDKSLVEKFSKIAEHADELVAHNGDRFDLKWFNTRHLLHGLPPIPQYKTVDTLKIAKKHFYLNSNRLDYLGRVLFGEGKIHTTFDLWKDVCAGDKRAMNQMVRYCKKDVELLQRVWEKLSAYDTPKTHAGVFGGGDRWTCPHCGSEEVHLSKTRPTPKGMIQRQMLCNDCCRYYTIANSVYNQYREKKEASCLRSQKN